MKEESFLKMLADTLELNQIPSGYYSLNGYAEEAVCMASYKENGREKWEVYLGERGKKCSLKLFDSLKMACIEVIERLAESYEQESAMKEEFEQSCEKCLVVIPASTSVKRQNLFQYFLKSKEGASKQNLKQG